MESKFINRYNSFCKSVTDLEKSVTADPEADFVLEGTVQNYNLTFDLSWKVMKDILVKELGILDYPLGSPRENLRAAFSNGLIDDDIWLQMLKVRNQLAHDYDGSFAKKVFSDITQKYYDIFCKFRDVVEKYYSTGLNKYDNFD